MLLYRFTTYRETADRALRAQVEQRPLSAYSADEQKRARAHLEPANLVRGA